MDKIPTEIISRIFAWASTDDGSTARSLRITSKYCSAVVEPYQHQSLVVTGLTQVDGLVRVLQQQQASGRLQRVKYLLIADQTEGQINEGFPMPSVQNGSVSANTAFVYQSGLMRKAREALRFSKLVYRLMELVAPALEDLTCLIFNPCSVDIMQSAFSFRFPRLRELSIRLSAWPSNALRPPLPPCLQMPALQCFHLGSMTDLADTFPLLDLVFTTCPALVSLHLCDVRLTSKSRGQLLHMLGYETEDDGDASSSATPRSPANVRRIVVEAHAEARIAEQSTALAQCQRVSSIAPAQLHVIPQTEERRCSRDWVRVWLEGDSRLARTISV